MKEIKLSVIEVSSKISSNYSNKDWVFKQLNRYTLNSMSKYTAIVVLVAGIITYLRINSKTDFQKFSEGKFY